MNNSISTVIADFIYELKFEDIPANVRELVSETLLMDALGVALASHEEEYADILQEVTISMGGREEATIWGTDIKVPMVQAALVNGTLIHGMDFDDTHPTAIVHPSSCIIPTAFAAGEFVGASGKDIITAAVGGYEIMVRLGLAAQGAFHDHGFHATGILGSFAAACTAAKLFNVKKEVLINSMGICGSMASGLQQFLHDGSDVKKLHPGWANHAGIYALLLAMRGFTGPTKVFDGKFGIWASYLGINNNLNNYFHDLSEIWHCLGITIKQYPCCHFTHSFIDCILNLKQTYGFSSEEVKTIECRIGERGYKICCDPIQEKKRPLTVYAARFSLPYTVATALLKGSISPKEFNKSYLQDKQISETIDKIVVIKDPMVENIGHFPGWVKVILHNGSEFQFEQKYEKGSLKNPLTQKDILSKFKNNASIFFAEENSNNLLNKIHQVESCTSINSIVKSLSK